MYRLEGCPACEAVLGSWAEAQRRRPSYATRTVEAAHLQPFEKEVIERFPTFAVRQEQTLLRLWDGGLRTPSAIVAWMDEVAKKGGVSQRPKGASASERATRRPRRATRRVRRRARSAKKTARQ